MIRSTCRSRPAFLTLAVATLVLPSLLPAKPKPQSPIRLEFIGPRQTIVPTLSTDGFPLTLRLTSIDELGIGIGPAQTTFPVYEEARGFIVFDDPDGCHSWAPLDACAVVDETYVEFTPGDSLPDVPDAIGDPFRMVGLSTLGGGSPQLLGFNVSTGVNDMLHPYGPDLGGPDLATMRCLSRFGNLGSCLTDADCLAGATCSAFPVEPDGYGLGADDDLPGLVLLSDTGVGLVLGQNGDPLVPRQARNLAGLVTSVSYELNDASRRTSIVAHLTAPEGAFNPVVQFDNCVAPPSDPTCACGPSGPTVCPLGPLRVRVDGGLPLDVTAPELRSVLESSLITVRAFVVNGTAPSILTDMDGDGLVTADDAALAGLQLLSGEEVVQFRQLHEKMIAAEQTNAIPFDFDGNGLFPIVFPTHGGTLTKVPR